MSPYPSNLLHVHSLLISLRKFWGFLRKKKSAVQLLNRVHEPTSTEETLRASGCWAQNSFKDWNESEDLWPLQEF